MNTTFQPTLESAQPAASSKDLTLNNYLQWKYSEYENVAKLQIMKCLIFS